MKAFFSLSVARNFLLGAVVGATAILPADTAESFQMTRKAADKLHIMKTVCVGRFLIEIPQEAAISFGRAAIDGLTIVNLGIESKERFNARLVQREEEINTGKTRSGMRNMEAIREVRREQVYGTIFVFNRDDNYYISNGKKFATSTVSINGFAYVDGASFAVTASVYKTENIESAVNLLEKLQPINEGAIPMQPGFCIDRAVIQDPLKVDQGESVTMFLKLPYHDDIGMALTTMAGVEPGQGLLERNRENRSGPYAYINSSLSTLLERQRTIHGIVGDELGFKVKETNRTSGYALNWESQGTRDDVKRPFVSLEMQTGTSARAGGESVESSLAEKDLLHMWRRMSSSLRLHSSEREKSEGALNQHAPDDRNRSLVQAQGLQ